MPMIAPSNKRFGAGARAAIRAALRGCATLFATLFAAVILGPLLLGLAGCDAPRPVVAVEVESPRQEPWSYEVVAAFGALPVQESGRVKPLSTWVGFKLYALNGKRKYVIPEGLGLPTGGEKLDPVRWALDVAFFDDQARHYEVFLVNDSKVLEEIGLEFPNRKRRDRYSYAQLMPGRDRLDQLAERARTRDTKQRTAMETKLLNLQAALYQYDTLRNMGRAASATVGREPTERMAALFPEAAEHGGGIPVAVALERFPTIVEWAQAVDMADTTAAERATEELTMLVESMSMVASPAFERAMPAMFPPATPEAEEWRNSAELVRAGIQGGVGIDTGTRRGLTLLGEAFLASPDRTAVEARLAELGEVGHGYAEARGVADDVALERSYYRANYFYWALVVFGLGTLTVVLGWLLPRVRAFALGTWALSTTGLVLVVAGLTVRCLLLDRPPVATLYETILFITAGAVLACLVAEKMTKYRIALGASVFLGLAGMFLAYKWEAREAVSQGDTMGGLIAVLNSNFWLATHVTTVTYGYAAGLMAAFLGHVWIGMRVVHGIRHGRKLPQETAKQMREFGGLLYGVICFALVLSTVGTILGGVWANDSWGRFWGWDPKENGALMIVLYQLVIVHARLGGYVKDFGIALLSVVGGAIVAFSWWHVNQLGVGLHSYGFTEGVVRNLMLYYGTVAGFTLLSLGAWSIWIRTPRKLGPA